MRSKYLRNRDAIVTSSQRREQALILAIRDLPRFVSEAVERLKATTFPKANRKCSCTL
jgi:hypothetical protein